MTIVRAALLTLVLLSGCGPRANDLLRADRQFSDGSWQAARSAYDRLALRADVSAETRAQALTGSAQASVKLGDLPGARDRLERAIVPDLPGVTEAALFYLAELLRESDHARALNLYYRAAAGAEKHRNGRFPYRVAMDRILQLSMSR
jgi:hypothetical protein